MHTYIHTHTHTCTHYTLIHTHTHSQTHILTHIHTLGISADRNEGKAAAENRGPKEAKGNNTYF